MVAIGTVQYILVKYGCLWKKGDIMDISSSTVWLFFVNCGQVVIDPKTQKTRDAYFDSLLDLNDST